MSTSANHEIDPRMIDRKVTTRDRVALIVIMFLSILALRYWSLPVLNIIGMVVEHFHPYT